MTTAQTELFPTRIPTIAEIREAQAQRAAAYVLECAEHLESILAVSLQDSEERLF